MRCAKCNKVLRVTADLGFAGKFYCRECAAPICKSSKKAQEEVDRLFAAGLIRNRFIMPGIDGD